MDAQTLKNIAHKLAGLPASTRRSMQPRAALEPSRLVRIAQSRTGDRFPLSPAQRQLWVVQRLQPDSGAYAFAVAARLRGRLNVGHFAAAFRDIENRHEVLRTWFPHDGEGPVQRVDPASSGEPLRHIDLLALPPEEAEGWTAAFLEDELGRPFHLEEPPLVRKALLQVGETEYVFALTLHHILCDEWSAGVLINEIGEAYNARVRGRAPALAPLPVQYADYAAWQDAREKDGSFDKQVEYWKAALAGMPDLQLPFDYPREAAPGSQGEVVTCALPAGAAAGLRELAAETQSTTFIVLLAMFQSFLSEWSGCADFGVGTPAANRDAPLTAGLIGYFVNTIVIRARIRREASFRALIADVRRTAVDAYTNQEAPFSLVVDALRPKRNYNSPPIFQVMMMFQTASIPSLDLQGLDAEMLAVPRRSSKFDLTLLARETPRELLLDWNYATGLFNRETISSAARSFGAWAELLLRFPGVPLRELAQRRDALD